MQVQERFEVDIKELPEQIDTATYSMFSLLGSKFILCHSDTRSTLIVK